MKPRTQPDRPRAPISWWLTAPRDGFTRQAEQEQERMRHGVSYFNDAAREAHDTRLQRQARHGGR